MMLREWFQLVYIPRRLRGKSEKTIRLYRLTLDQFDRTLGRPAQVEDLTEDWVLAHLARRSAVAPATRNKELSQLVALWRLAAQRGTLPNWPDIQKEHEPERAPVAWLEDELYQLIEAAYSMTGKIGKIPENIYWPLMIRLTLDTGERSGAIRQCEWGWVQRSWLLMPAEARKGKTRDRRYRMSAETQKAFQDMRRVNRDPKQVFPWPYCNTYFWAKYRRVVKRAGLPTTRKHQMHCLRKTTASAIYAAGLDPQDALDHADRRTTQRYIDPRFTRDRQGCDVLEEFMRRRRES